MNEGERLSRSGFAECVDLVLAGLATTDSEQDAFRWRPSTELNQGVSTIWVAFQDEGIEGLDAEEEQLVLSMYNDFDDLSNPELADRRREILDHLGIEARLLKTHASRRA
jgi:hypothetical protein